MSFATNIIIPLTVSLAIHGIIIGALVIGWESQQQPKRIVPPNYIEAKLVKLETQSTKKASAPRKPKKIDLTARREEQERLKREAEKRRLAKAAQEKAQRAKKEAEERERKEKEEASHRQAEKLQRQKAQEQRLQQEFEQALLEEQGMLMEEEYAVEAQSYVSKFQQRIQSNWSRPPSARTGMRCLLSIQLVPTGRIVAVNIEEGSGNAAFDRSAIQAVKKVELFPEVKEMSPETFERYFRKFTLSFNPQDLRL